MRHFNNILNYRKILIELSASSSTSSSGAESDEMLQDLGNPREGSSKTSSPKRHKHIVTPELTAALDRAKVSDRMAIHTVAAAAVGLGHHIDKFSISHSTLNRLRKKNRQLSCEKTKKDFNPDAPLVVHWDGKLLQDITERETVERLPILVTGQGTEMLLGVPKLKDGTGETVASAVLETIQDWDANLIDKISGMSFDTTPSNTGRQAGACVLFEKKLNKPLLHLACRHHIMEIVIGEVFKKCFGVSSGPVIPIFKRFKEEWKHLKQDSYMTAKEDPKCLETLNASPIVNDITEFVQLALQEKQPRNDYKELLELTLYFLGVKTKEIHFMAPGAYHLARWMAKIIYTIKIWLFREQFKLTPREIESLRSFTMFAVLVYVKQWFQATDSTSAPLNDLLFLQTIQEYSKFDDEVSKVATKAITRHLWYLSEELTPLAFFSKKVLDLTKIKMVEALRNTKTVDLSRSPARLESIDLNNIANMTLDKFITPKSMIFF